MVPVYVHIKIGKWGFKYIIFIQIVILSFTKKALKTEISTVHAFTVILEQPNQV